MDARAITDDFVSKYSKLLDNVHGDGDALTSMKVNILCCQYNKNHHQNSQQHEKESPTIENHCQHCLIPWKYGRFTMKTYPKHQKKNSKLQKKRTKFIMVMKCLVCSRVTKLILDKNKVQCQKSIKKLSTNNKPVQNIIETPKIEEEKVDVNKKKPKKKKRNLYAGLNPLVFKNRDLCKKKKKIKNL